MKQDKEICVICFAYFIRPKQTRAITCSDLCHRRRKAETDKRPKAERKRWFSDHNQEHWVERCKEDDAEFQRRMLSAHPEMANG